MGYIWSAKKNGFYPLSEQDRYKSLGLWPDDGVEVTDEQHAAIFLNPVQGKVIGTENGRPAWVTPPPPTVEELQAGVQAKINALRAEADSVISPLKDALEGGYIDDADKPKLTAWQKYRYALTKVDLANPVWPEMPI